MTAKFSNMYLTSMKVTNKKVIHYLRKKRFGGVESRDNRKRGNGDSKRILKKLFKDFGVKKSKEKVKWLKGNMDFAKGGLSYLFTVREKCQHVCVLIGITKWVQTEKTDDAGSLEVMKLNI